MMARITFAPIMFSALAVASAYTGVATFNDYAAQSNTVCGSKTGTSGTYGAAVGDLSPDIWSGDKCSGSIDTSKCNGQSPVSGYSGPSCPTTTCGKCFKVCNKGGYGGASIGGVGNCVVVDIIDACPSESAYNFCKTDVAAEQRCGSSSTNALDIDESAYKALTGESFGSGPNLEVSITPASC